MQNQSYTHRHLLIVGQNLVPCSILMNLTNKHVTCNSLLVEPLVTTFAWNNSLLPMFKKTVVP